MVEIRGAIILLPVLLSLLAVSSQSLARPKIPLMPPRFDAVEEGETYRGPAENFSGSDNPSLRLGVAFGAFGRSTNVDSDASGLGIFYGGRLFGEWAASRNVFLKPSLGYFRRHEGTDKVGVTTNDFELGLDANYVPWPWSRFRLGLGIVQRVEVLVNTISAFNASATSSPAFRYRAGPAMELGAAISRTLTFVTNLEVAFSLTTPIRTYPGITAGLSFAP